MKMLFNFGKLNGRIGAPIRGAMVPWKGSGCADHKRHVDSSIQFAEQLATMGTNKLPEWEGKKPFPGVQGAEPLAVLLVVP